MKFDEMNQPEGKESSLPDYTRLFQPLRWRDWLIPVVALGLLSYTAVQYVQAPRPADKALTQASPDGRFLATAKTICSVRIASRDDWSYRFVVKNASDGQVLFSSLIEIPYDKLTTGETGEVGSMANYLFADHGGIIWNSDATEVVFHVRGVELWHCSPNPLPGE